MLWTTNLAFFSEPVVLLVGLLLLIVMVELVVAIPRYPLGQKRKTILSTAKRAKSLRKPPVDPSLLGRDARRRGTDKVLRMSQKGERSRGSAIASDISCRCRGRGDSILHLVGPFGGGLRNPVFRLPPMHPARPGGPVPSPWRCSCSGHTRFIRHQQSVRLSRLP